MKIPGHQNHDHQEYDDQNYDYQEHDHQEHDHQNHDHQEHDEQNYDYQGPLGRSLTEAGRPSPPQWNYLVGDVGREPRE